MSKMRHAVTALILSAASTALVAQDTTRADFDVVSIKRVDDLRQGGGMRTLPDGTFMMMNQPLGTLMNMASPVYVSGRDVVGLPDWTMRDRYDVTVKPPAGLSREQLREQWPMMWRAMFADRMKLAAHIEQRERDVYHLVVARGDGKLGPDLTPSTLDCTRPPADDSRSRCGLSMAAGLIVSGGITMDRLVPSLGGLAGGDVENHTGLKGDYALTLRFSSDDAPDFFTALREQLGLKLEREKKLMPVFVIDHIERPTEN